MGRSLNSAGFVFPFVTLQATASNPAATTSVPGVMMGTGSTFAITPGFSGRLHICLQAQASVSVATAAFTVQLRYGTGTAPINGAAITGTALGASLSPWSAVANSIVPFTLTGVVTGLTVGTAYWIDFSLGTSTGTATSAGVSCNAMEF